MCDLTKKPFVPPAPKPARRLKIWEVEQSYHCTVPVSPALPANRPNWHNLRDLQPMANGSADFHRDNLQINRGRRWPFSSGLILATAAAGALLMGLIRLA